MKKNLMLEQLKKRRNLFMKEARKLAVALPENEDLKNKISLNKRELRDEIVNTFDGNEDFIIKGNDLNNIYGEVKFKLRQIKDEDKVFTEIKKNTHYESKGTAIENEQLYYDIAFRFNHFDVIAKKYGYTKENIDNKVIYQKVDEVVNNEFYFVYKIEHIEDAFYFSVEKHYTKDYLVNEIMVKEEKLKIENMDNGDVKIVF